MLNHGSSHRSRWTNGTPGWAESAALPDIDARARADLCEAHRRLQPSALRRRLRVTHQVRRPRRTGRPHDGLLHALVAMDLPGAGSVFLSQQWKFTAPVYIGDTITAEAEVLSVPATKPVTQLGIVVKRQTGETVLEGEAWCYTLRPDATASAAGATAASGRA